MTLGLTWKKIYNHLLGEYRVRAYQDDSDQDWVQVVALESSLGLPSAPTPVSGTFTRFDSITGTASLITAADTDRIGGFIVAPKSNTDTCYIWNDNTVTSNDIPIYPGGVFQFTLNFGGAPLTNAIYAISGSGTQKLRLVIA